MNEFVCELVRVINTYRRYDDVEIEIRFGWKQSGVFETNMGKKTFDALNVYFNEMQETKSPIRTQSSVYIDPKRDVRKVDNDTHIKKRLEIVDIALEGTPFDVRIAASVETPVSVEGDSDSFQLLRTRDRQSFSYKHWKYELTESVLNRPVNNSNKVYELEIEFDIDLLNKLHMSSSIIAESVFTKIQSIVGVLDPKNNHLKNCRVINKKKYRHRIYNPIKNVQRDSFQELQC